MNSKLKATTLLSITALLAISVIAISEMPEAEAKKWKGKPDLIAKIKPIEGTDSVARGMAFFWFGDYEDGLPTTMKYKMILGRIAVTEDGSEPERYRTPEYVTKIHLHEAPDGYHTAPHIFNIIVPNHDADLKVKLQRFVSGLWDPSDVRTPPPPPPNLDLKTGVTTAQFGENNDESIRVLEAVCTGQTDVNVHGSTNTGGTARGILQPFSDACEEILDELED